jgi:hypothetical protein
MALSSRRWHASLADQLEAIKRNTPKTKVCPICRALYDTSRPHPCESKHSSHEGGQRADD